MINIMKTGDKFYFFMKIENYYGKIFTIDKVVGRFQKGYEIKIKDLTLLMNNEFKKINNVWHPK